MTKTRVFNSQQYRSPSAWDSNFVLVRAGVIYKKKKNLIIIKFNEKTTRIRPLRRSTI